MTMNLISSKTKFYENGEIRRCDIFELGKYEVKRLTVFQGAKVVYKDFTISTEEEYLPTIQYNDGFFSKDAPGFTIQTTAYGAKGVKEIEKIIAGYQEAVEAVKVLTINFC